MIQRFVSATAVASVAIACGALALFGAAHTYTLNNPYQIAVVWCVVPATWGVWAILAPKSWVPSRLPNWGAVLGLIAGVMALFVLNIPSRILEQAVSWRLRIFGLLVAVVGYYLLWMAVRAVHWALMPPGERTHKAAA